MPKPTLCPYSTHNKPYQFAVYFDGPSGSRRKRRRFVTKQEAKTFLTDKEVEFANLGRSIATGLDDDVKREAHEATKLLGEFDVSLVAAADHYRKHLLATSKSAPISGLIVEFVAQKRATGRSKHHVDDLEKRLERFAKVFGDRYATDVEAQEIEDWLFGMAGLSNRTRNHYRSKVHSFFAWCVRKRRCTANPVAGIERAEEQPTVCEIYSPAEMRTMLAAAVAWQPKKIKAAGSKRGHNRVEFSHHTSDLLADLLFCGFAGLRQSEFAQLTWEMVKLDRSKIDLPAEITKMKRRKLVTIQPVLAAWIVKHFPERKGPVMQKKNFVNRMKGFKRHLREQHGLEWKDNGLRHSFASYLLEKKQSAEHVAMELGHRGGVSVLWDHYAERVGVDDAATYWALTPEAVAGEIGGGVVAFDQKAGVACG